MKKSFIVPLLLAALLLTACTRDETFQPSASPMTQATSSPATDMPPVIPNTGDQSAEDARPLTDGVYHAEVSDTYASSKGHGWKEYLKLTVENQQIASVEFDGLKDGKKKSEVAEAEYPMTPHPSEWIPQINQALRNAALPEAMDTVSGATMSSAVARQLYAAALRASRDGNTETVIVDIT